MGALVKQLQQGGCGRQGNSWVSNGKNMPIAPRELEDALGPEIVQALQDHTGMPRAALLSDLSHILPDAVHELTPDGREPDDDDLEMIATIDT